MATRVTRGATRHDTTPRSALSSVAMRRARVFSWVVVGLLAATLRLEAATIVFCSPGSPGDTAQAKPAMDQLARAVETSGGLKAGTVTSAYHEAEAAGIEALRAPETLVAAVPVPFFVAHGKELGLEPRLGIVTTTGQPERYALVTRKGTVSKPADLAGWEVTGTAGYSAGFVRRVFGREWGALPDDVRVTFTASPLQALRRAATGEKLAVVLDAAQSASLSNLPFGADLSVLARSGPLPAGLVCALKPGAAAGTKTQQAILKGLDRLPKSPEGKEALLGIRIERFEAIDAAGVARLRADFGDPGASKP